MNEPFVDTEGFGSDEVGAVVEERRLSNRLLKKGDYRIDLFAQELGGFFWWLAKMGPKAQLVRIEPYDDRLYFVRFRVLEDSRLAPAVKQPDGSTIINYREDETFPYAYPSWSDGVEHVTQATAPNQNRPIQIFQEYIDVVAGRMNAAASGLGKKVDSKTDTLLYGALIVAGIWAWRQGKT